MNKNDIINRLEDLNFDKSGYWVLAGSAMVLHGIRPETHDIDMGCTKEFADELETEGYPTVVMPDGTRRITYAEDVEIFEDWIFDRVVFVDEIPVISLEGLLEMKRSLGREKDMRDVQMIEEFLGK
ncbi:MAG: hypothetical protein IKL06_05300 [Lachnospiraceae bacterium]|nr:hypothetical protein [Lachnospiraceae bacterium]